MKALRGRAVALSFSDSVNFHGWPSIRRSCALLVLGGHHSSLTERPCRCGHGPSTLSAHRPGTARSASAHVSARYGSVTIMTAVRLGVSSDDCRQRPASGLSSGACSDCFAASSSRFYRPDRFVFSKRGELGGRVQGVDERPGKACSLGRWSMEGQRDHPVPERPRSQIPGRSARKGIQKLELPGPDAHNLISVQLLRYLCPCVHCDDTRNTCETCNFKLAWFQKRTCL